MRDRLNIELPNVIEMGTTLSTRSSLVLTNKGGHQILQRIRDSKMKNSIVTELVNQCLLVLEVTNRWKTFSIKIIKLVPF